MHAVNNTKKLKFIVVTGGVLSGLGKGVAAASIGKLLSSKLKIVPMKLDGYLNVDPGTMNPIEHGEVFVLDDGGEVDMDFGHYERFINTTCKFEWNLTMGKVFTEIRERERKGDYLGKTVQFVPHVVDLIKEKFFQVAEKENADLMLIEVGGTVGDIENEPYIEAVRQLKSDVGSENILYVHLTYVPIPGGVNEQKTKPTQQSVKMLTERGIQPDVIIGRSPEKLGDNVKEKIACFCGLKRNEVISGVDVDSVYKIPLIFEMEGLSGIIHKKLQIYSPPDLREWQVLVDNLNNLKESITIAICGKYTNLEDSYASINEALMHCSAQTKHKIDLKFIETTNIENGDISIQEALQGVNGVIIPGGFGDRGTEGKIEVIKHCREQKIPFLGICLGLQLAVVEYARNVCELYKANSSEIDKNTLYPVVDFLPEQRKIENKGGTMRLGSYKAILKEGSLAKKLYKSEFVWERHRHRYEVNPDYHQILQNNGLVISGISPDERLAEFIEIDDHPYFIATQSHPELKSKLIKPAPLFLGLVNSVISRKSPLLK
ncbi:MAG: CTP synthase (glutamine hydrolyzing) [Nanoarchaeota archaeon]|nr:CTP synthase (glutamine hydrolyzing) [Nanoarchaeota archaeon]MBU1632146.1 CTP synthase (glutamine hydrolyzing) [Nanoarchaeota archaeon]MBU1876347.1 CTP synthase (glutamine hydrolyzing) [Nanoarchaeota archaeon]